MDGIDISSVWWSIALVTLPGFVLGVVSGLRFAWAAAGSLPLTFSVYGLGGWLLGVMNIEFRPLSVTIFWLVMLALAAAWRLSFTLIRRARQPKLAGPVTADGIGPDDKRPRWWAGFAGPGSIADPVWIIPALGVAVGAWLIIDRSLTWLSDTPNGVHNIFQGWDVQWHANVTRWVVEEGIASPTRMGELQNLETQDPLYYPAAFHAAAGLVAQLGNLHPIAAVNLISVIVPGLGFPLTAAALAWMVVGNRGWVAQIAAGLSGVIVAAIPALNWIGQYVGAWPYIAAVGVSGVVAALFFGVVYRPVTAAAAALGLTGLTQLHPSPVTNVVLIVGLWWLLHLLWRPARPELGALRSRARDLALLGGAGIAGTLLMLPQLLIGTGQAEEVTGWDATEDISRTQSWVTAVTLDTRHVSQFFIGYDPTTLLILAGIGAVLIICWRRNFWAPVFYLLSVVLTVHGLKPFDVPGSGIVSLLAGLHYATPHRLIMPVALLTVVAAAVAVAVGIRLISGGPLPQLVHSNQATWRRATTVATVVVTVLAGRGAAAWVDTKIEDGGRASYQAARESGRMVNTDDLAAWDWLAKQPHAYDGLISVVPADGSGWMYAYNALPSLHRHYSWPIAPRDSATDTVFWDGSLIGGGLPGNPGATNPVDEAYEKLDITYFYLGPWNFWSFQHPDWELLHGLWVADAVTPVYKDGLIVIFAVNNQFTAGELAQLTRPGNSPDPLPSLTPVAEFASQS